MNTRIRRIPSLLAIVVLLVVGSLSSQISGQTPSPSPSPSPSVTETPVATPMPTAEPVPSATPEATPVKTPAKAPALNDYKGIKIGTPTDDVRKKLGSPEDKGDEQDFYIFSDHETAQFFYDTDHTVKAIAITYTGDLGSALTPMQVFGEDIAPNAEGGVFNMVRYPEAGYWVSYNRSPGDNPVISIAIQKM